MGKNEKKAKKAEKKSEELSDQQLDEAAGGVVAPFHPRQTVKPNIPNLSRDKVADRVSVIPPGLHPPGPGKFPK